METQPALSDKQEWQMPILEVLVTEKTENGADDGDDGAGLFTLS